MANDLRLQVIMDLANKASAPLRNISRSSTEAAQALKATHDTLKQLNEQQRTIDGFTKQQAAMRESSNKLRVLRQNLDTLRLSQSASKREIDGAEKALAKQTERYEKQRDAVFKLRHQLTALGINKVSEAQARLKTETTNANQALERQTAKLKELNTQKQKLWALKDRHGKDMLHTGMLAGAGVAGMAAGRGMARPVLSTIGAFAQQESATSQLKAAMMLADGSVSAEFKQINELAMRLGDRLPGTTTDFIEMMKVLKEQGISARSILGGTGEAAAYLGVQLKLPAAEAAKFAAQMQDATRTTERDMMALMDVIQRVKYTGVDSGYMLQGFSKMSSVLSVIKQEGVQAANTLAPLLSMMNQAGMTDGGSAGNAIRKVFDHTLDLKKLGKANAVLAGAGAGFKLNFTDAKGNFAGLDNVFAQLDRIKAIDSDTTRKSVLKELFGDDAETHQVLQIMMDKGKAGYEATIAKLKEQASLRQRVDAELQTITNLWDAATGSFQNVLAEIGSTVSGDVKALTTWIGEVASGIRAWVAEHPVLVGWLVKTVAVVAGLSIGLGSLMLAVASVLGPFLAMRFVLSWLGLKFNLWGAAIRGTGTALLWAGKALLFIGRLMLLNPIGLAITAIATAAFLIYQYWGPIKGFFAGLWAGIVQGLSGLWQRFTDAGRMMMDGLVGGITSRLQAVKDAVGSAASGAIDWFKEKLGIRSPSRVFMAAGEHIGEGTAMGIARSSALVRGAAAGLTAAAMVPLGATPIDTRAPLGAGGQRAPIVVQGDTITIQITAAPGADAQALARAISAELDRRDRAKAARMRSTLGDIT